MGERKSGLRHDEAGRIPVFWPLAVLLLAVLLCAALCLVGSMNDMTSSSVSLEGKCLWQAQSLPVKPWQVLRAKLLVQVVITGVPMLLASVCATLTVRPGLLAAVLLVRQVDVTDIAVLELIQNMFPDRQHDFVLSVSESDIVVIKEMAPDETSEDVCALAETIERAVQTELHVQTVIGIGTAANHLRELADRYKEAQVAIEVGKVFENEKPVIHYDNLGIGRIIYQLPTTLCEMFLSEAFKKNPIEALDEDTLDTINRFFENNLNVSETARKLYVHRNTLVYRLEKVKKITGLDLREFEDAILFKVAVMVKQYLDSQNTAKF